MNVYWWSSRNGTKNLGDEITAHILERLIGCSFFKSGMHDADIISTGSILGWVYESQSPLMITRSKRLSVLGSGFMRPQTVVQKKDYLNFCFVRGYLTKNILGNQVDPELAVGDPGIVLSDIVSRDITEKRYKYGIIPHIGSYGRQGFFENFDNLNNKIFIDFRTNDVDGVVEKMRQCEIIISQSLHGLIFSDSLGLPNVWLDTGDLHAGGCFKFYDYFSTINRPFYKKCAAIDIHENYIENNLFFPDKELIDNRKLIVKNCLFDFFEKYGL
jgi:hypothetical protein